MVNFSDLKFYDSQAGLGGAIDTGDEILTATPNNLFINFQRSELVSGTIKYKCFYMKNTSSEDMEKFKIWISKGTPLERTRIAFAFDDLATPFDGAVGFNGTNDYINCGSHTDLWSKALNKFSFATWIWPTAAGDGSFRDIVYHVGTEGSTSSFELYIDSADANKVTFEIVDSVGTSHKISSDGELDLNSWNHVICSYDSTLGSDNLRIWVNGVEGSSSALNRNFTGTITLVEDLRLANSSTDFKGYMKDFKFWDDQSVNTDEAAELYADNEIVDSTPAYHLQFSERTGSTTKDAVSKTKTATLANGAFWKVNAQTIADTFTEPTVFNDLWYGSDEIPNGTFKIKTGLYVPIWARVTADADADATEYLDDYGIFTINFDITATGTPSTGTPGTGGGTGGSTGGTGTANYKIAVAGDWGNTGTTSKVISMMKSQDYDLILGVGDNAYDDSSASSWTSKFNTFKSKMESAFGNHEYEEDGGISPYKNFFGYSKTYNKIRFQNCLILILDSNDDKSGVDLNAQRTWAKDQLETYKNDTNVVWRIVVMHHPWFGSGAKHEENEFDQVQKFHKLFTDYDVNFVYTGHNHHWMRSHQVAYNSGDPTDPTIIDSSSPYSRSGNGLMEIRSGTGGHDGEGDLYSLSDADSFWAYRNKSNNGVHELVASNSGKTLTGRFRNVDNQTTDTFTITA
jgi:concanavalin A-like lectin/glucanase superfamily protein